MDKRLIGVLKDIQEFIGLQAAARNFKFVENKGKLEEYVAVRNKIRVQTPYLVYSSKGCYEAMKYNFITWPEYVIGKMGGKLVRISEFEKAWKFSKKLKKHPMAVLREAVARQYGPKAQLTLGSASMTRASQFFTLTGISLPELYEIAAVGKQFYGTEANISKASARIFANMSSGQTIGFAKKFGTDSGEIEDATGIELDVQVFTIADYVFIDASGNKHTIGDGLSFLNHAFMAWIAEKLGLGYVPVGAQLRIGGGKTFGQEVSTKALKKILADNGYDTKTIDFTKPIVVCPQSAWKFDPSWPVFPVTVLRTTRPKKEDSKVRTTYQLINALKDGEWIDELAKETLGKLLSKDPQTVLEAFGLFADYSEDVDGAEEELTEDAPLYKKLFEIVKANPEKALTIPSVRAQIGALMEKKARDVARGRFIVNGSFLFMALDENIFMNNIAGKTEDNELILSSVDGCLNEGEVATPFSGNVVAARFPLATPNEPKKLVSKNIMRLASGKEVSIDQDIIYFNAIGCIWEGMSGADFDGDTCLVTTDKRVFDNVMDWPAVPDVPKIEGGKVLLNEGNMLKTIANNMIVPGIQVDSLGKKVDAMVVGQIAIYIANLLNKMHGDGLGHSDNVRYVSKLTYMEMTSSLSYADAMAKLYEIQNYVIDFAKTGYMPDIGAELTDIIPAGRVSFALPSNQYPLARRIAKMLAEGNCEYAELRVCDVNPDSEDDSVFTFAHKTHLALMPLLIEEALTAYREFDINSDYNTCAIANQNVLASVVNIYDAYARMKKEAKSDMDAIVACIEEMTEKVDFLAAEHGSIEVGLALIDIMYAKNVSAGKFGVQCGYRHVARALAAEERLVLKKSGQLESVAAKEYMREEQAVSSVKAYAIQYGAYANITDKSALIGKPASFEYVANAGKGKARIAVFVDGKKLGLVDCRDEELEIYRAHLCGAKKVVADVTIVRNGNKISQVLLFFTNKAEVAAQLAKKEAAADSVANDNTAGLVMKLEGDKRSQIIQASFAAKYAAMANKKLVFIASEDAAKIIDFAARGVVNASVESLAQKDKEYYDAYMTLVGIKDKFVVRVQK